MSRFTRWFVILVAGSFFVVALWAFAHGALKAGVGGMFFGFLVSMIGGIGWFDSKYPLTAKKGETLGSAIERYAQTYPGWPSKIAAGFLLCLVVLGLIAAAGKIAGY